MKSVVCIIALVNVLLFQLSLNSFTKASYDGFNKISNFPSQEISNSVTRITNDGVLFVKNGEFTINNLNDTDLPFSNVFSILNLLNSKVNSNEFSI
jgi:hypothetical protein